MKLLMMIVLSVLLLSVTPDDIDDCYSGGVLTTIEVVALHPKTEYDSELLARIAQAEAIGEGLIGMQAVMEVVINRVQSPKFPNTILRVITQEKQFCGYATKLYNREIREDVKKTAIYLLLGKSTKILPNTALFFHNPTIVGTRYTSRMVSKYSSIVIRNHIFHY